MKKKTNSMNDTYQAPCARWTDLRPDLTFCISLNGGLEDTYDDIIDEG